MNLCRPSRTIPCGGGYEMNGKYYHILSWDNIGRDLTMQQTMTKFVSSPIAFNHNFSEVR